MVPANAPEPKGECDCAAKVELLGKTHEIFEPVLTKNGADCAMGWPGYWDDNDTSSLYQPEGTVTADQ